MIQIQEPEPVPRPPKKFSVHTYLYQDHDDRKPGLAEMTDAPLDVVAAGEFDAIAELQRDSLDQDMGDWLIGYLENLIARHELYALRFDGEILGTGEARVSDSQPPLATPGPILQGSGHHPSSIVFEPRWKSALGDLEALEAQASPYG